MIKLNGKTIEIESDPPIPIDRAYLLPDTIFVSHSTYKALEDLLGEYKQKQEFKEAIDKKIEDLLK